ncbi:MAG: hypothetical protein CJBNEKGG_04005 [Prosthecobacter sp.]|nr:hypothetical protein [Prosthecobacter sp.]
MGDLPLQFVRYSNTRRVSQNSLGGPFGRESVWTHNYQWLMRDAGTVVNPWSPLDEETRHFPVIRITFPDGSDYDFVSTLSVEDEEQIGMGEVPYMQRNWVSVQAATSVLTQEENDFTLQLQDGTLCQFTDVNQTWSFSDNDAQGGSVGQVQELWKSRGASYYLTAIVDASGNEYAMEYQSMGGGSLLKKVTDPSGRYLEFTYSMPPAERGRFSKTYAQVRRNQGSTGEWQEIVVNSHMARYLMMIVRNPVAGLPALRVSELEFYDLNNQLITGTPFGANQAGGPGNAFDGNTATFYQHESPTSGYVGIDCGSPKRVSRIRYFVTGDTGVSTEFELVGMNQGFTSNHVITQVSAGDGRSVSYAYTTVTDPTGWFNWDVLSTVSYQDGAVAAYEHQQVEPFGRPLMKHCVDPRLEGNGTSIEYTFDENGPVGFLSSEKSGVTGELIASTGSEGPHLTKAVYPSGRIVSYAYAPGSGRLTSMTNGLGGVTAFTYDASGFRNSITDPLGRVTSITNNAQGLPLLTTLPDGTQEVRTYDGRNRLMSVSLQGAGLVTRTTSYARDSLGRVTQITHPDGTMESWTYNSYGQPVTHTQRNGQTESFSYDISGRLLARTDAVGSVTSYACNTLDQVETITDPLGRVQGFLYNDRGQVTRHTFADGTFVEYDYDDFGNLITQVNELGHFWSTTHDEFRNPLTKTDPLGRITTFSYGENSPSACGACRSSGKPSAVTSPGGRVIRYTYDLEWRLTSETDAFGTAHAATTNYAYDAAGNRTQVTDPGGSTTTHVHDVMDRVVSTTDPLGRTSSRSYDRAGNVISETRPDNGVTGHTYDQMNRRLSTEDAKHQVTQFAYDASGNLLTLTDARGKAYGWLYNAVNQPVQKNYPDGSHEQWTYDAAGQRVTARSRNGAVATSTFDLRGRETAVDWSDSTPDITRTYDLAGHLLTSGNGLSSSSYSYDSAGQQLTETQHLHGIAPSLPAYTVSYTWDADGRNATVTYPGGTVVSRTYTPRGQVETVSEGAPPPLVTYAYNVSGTRAWKALENGIITSYQYDVSHQLTNLNHSLGGNSVQSRAYQYNSVGNRSAMQVDGGMWDVYGFDAVDQVTSVKYQAASSTGTSPQSTTTYDWDPVGNREVVQTTPASGPIVTDTYGTANAVNQYAAINAQNTGYDSNGNLTSARLQDAGSGPVSTLGYDSQNHLLSASDGTHSVTSTYDTRNRVTSRTINGVTTLFLWDGWNLIEERDLNGAQTRRYVYGATVDEILIMVDATGAKYHLHDALGSVTALTDSTGAVLESYKYDVFGKVTVTDSSLISHPSSPLGNRFLYTGREWIAEASLYDYRNRVYSPVIGRFMQIDPIRFDAGDVNLYRYVGNSTQSWRDANGLYAGAIGFGELLGGALAGAATGAAAGSVIPGIGTGAGMVVGVLAGLFLFPATADAPEVPVAPSAPVIDTPGSTPPFRGEPGTTVRGGTQTREYGDDGYPLKDRDLPHPDEGPPGNGDHSHDWTRPPGGGPPIGPPGKPNPYRGPPREPQSGDPPCPRGPNVPPPTPLA